MTSPNRSGVYPNPTSGKTWTDGLGRVWHRRGGKAGEVTTKRMRALLRRDDVALATWWAGVVQWFEEPDAKQSAADGLYEAARWSDDIVPSEWMSQDGTHILMLEHHC